MTVNNANIEARVDIAAPPSQVWAIVSDLKRMGEWSPQCKTMRVFGDVKQGTRTFNINGQGKLRWPTNAKVVEFEPDKKLAFQILENRTIWSYELEPTVGGTRLTESRRAPRGVSRLSNLLTAKVFGGTEKFEASLEQGIQRTLDRIKVEAEA